MQKLVEPPTFEHEHDLLPGEEHGVPLESVPCGSKADLP